MNAPMSAVVLLVLVVMSAIGVVYSKHLGRTLFVELQALGEARDDMNIEWGQLQLEQGTLTTQGEVEAAARKRLGMVNLSARNTVIIRP